MQIKLPGRLRIGLIVIGIGFAVTIGFFVNVIGRVRSVVNEPPIDENPFTPPAVPLYEATDPPMTVKLFFPSAHEALLNTEDQTIFRSAQVANRAKQIIQKLLEGPKSETMFPSIPPETKIQELFVSAQNIAFIDFSNTIATNHAGGVLNEQATIYSIVNSLTYNLPEIQQVKILIGGIEKETLAGHCLLLLPLEMDLSITNMTSKPEAAAAPGSGQTYD